MMKNFNKWLYKLRIRNGKKCKRTNKMKKKHWQKYSWKKWGRQGLNCQIIFFKTIANKEMIRKSKQKKIEKLFFENKMKIEISFHTLLSPFHPLSLPFIPSLSLSSPLSSHLSPAPLCERQISGKKFEFDKW